MTHNHVTAVISEDCPECRENWPEFLPGPPVKVPEDEPDEN